MRTTGTKTRPLDEALRRMGAKLEAWQVRALILGAHASTNLQVGPQHLIGHICGDEPIMGRDAADANENLQSLMSLWNELVEDHQRGRIALSKVRTGKRPTTQELDALTKRRNDEITWFLRGIDASGDDPTQFGDDGEVLFRRLAEASNFLESFQELLTRTPESDLAKARKTLDQLTVAIETIIQDLLTISDGIREGMIAEIQEMAGRRTDDSVPARRPVKVGRNEPCPCGSGRKWKRCCGAPTSLH
jgi:hypothetical protein